MMYSCQQATQAIEAWKAHQLRSQQQDKCRIDILRELSADEVFVTQDWAMKFLPVKYRETQTDWYGKRGISWHISVVVKRTTDGKFEHRAFVHVAQNCSLDSNVVVSVIDHILRALKVEHPEIRRASFRQDNAGCYHSATLLAACRLMQQTTGIKVKRVDFSDPQGGKGPCDRKAATIKAHVRRFVDEGHDVLTATDLRDAILSNNGVRGVRVAVVNVEGVGQMQPTKWEEMVLRCGKYKTLVKERPSSGLNCKVEKGDLTLACALPATTNDFGPMGPKVHMIDRKFVLSKHKFCCTRIQFLANFLTTKPKCIINIQLR